CLREQQELGLRLDVETCKTVLADLEAEKENKVVELIAAMPKVPIKVIRNRPKIFYKQDGTLSANGEKWVELCKQNNLPRTHTEPIEIITGWEEGNPNSHEQIKAWLYTLGWKPE